ncbi:hypothetical protein ACFVWX_31885 [Streptomyces sp. NPDC058220]|uniref:hypothetical protein n=1 Tax=unclassified Streptomyces TaxID=2593676 RepID=UPI003669AF4A
MLELLMSGNPPAELMEAVATHAVCELGEGHGGEHADHVWDEDERGGAMWFLWTDSAHRFAVLRWCETLAADPDEACTVFAEHPSAHSWAVVDPVREALWADVERHPERWEFGGG